MAVQQTAFQQFLENEVNKVKGIYYPVKAGFLTQAFVRKAVPKKLHPNPGDEFCDPKIGPNYEIISGYEKQYRQAGRNPNNLLYTDGEIKEPLMVEKTHPDGYMILNGHHRWAAAMRADMKKIRIKVINLTSDSDLQKMLSASGFERSASLDLDEVLFVNPQTHKTEPQLPFPMKYLYPERLRLGTPELIRSLQRLGYEVWVYTSSFRSESYIRQLFRQYGEKFNGIVNGQRHEKEVQGNSPRRLPQKMPTHYRISLHIDDEEVICTAARQHGFRAYQLNAEDDDWKEKIIERAAQIRKLEHFE